MSRNGKIARLPGEIREEINRRLQDGVKGRDIVAWLNSSDKVKSVLTQDFDGHEINEINLTHWRKGGFRDWQAQQQAIEESRRVTSEGRQLADTGPKSLADNLAVWLLGRYIVATRGLIGNKSDKAAWKLLREVCHDVVALRRGEHS